jgi:hypothetical protein
VAISELIFEWGFSKKRERVRFFAIYDDSEILGAMKNYPVLISTLAQD